MPSGFVFRVIPSTLFTKVSSYGCDELVEGSQGDNPASCLTECCLTFDGGSSRDQRVAVEALRSPVGSGKDLGVSMGGRHDLKASAGGIGDDIDLKVCIRHIN